MITRADHTARRTGSRPRWLVPALVVAAGAGVLLYLGVLTPSSLLSIGLFGSMFGMHLLGHGAHGGHGRQGAHGRNGEASDSSAAGVAGEADQATQHRGGCH